MVYAFRALSDMLSDDASRLRHVAALVGARRAQQVAATWSWHGLARAGGGLRRARAHVQVARSK
eukprot:5639032-Alexandrium_andersonii.AAC.1